MCDSYRALFVSSLDVGNSDPPRADNVNIHAALMSYLASGRSSTAAAAN